MNRVKDAYLFACFMCRYMTKKLLSFANGECCEESADNPMNQELLLSGHLVLMLLKVP